MTWPEGWKDPDAATDMESLSPDSAGQIGLGESGSSHASVESGRHIIMHHVSTAIIMICLRKMYA